MWHVVFWSVFCAGAIGVIGIYAVKAMPAGRRTHFYNAVSTAVTVAGTGAVWIVENAPDFQAIAAFLHIDAAAAAGAIALAKLVDFVVKRHLRNITVSPPVTG